jgi:hypothetical protein
MNCAVFLVEDYVDLSRSTLQKIITSADEEKQMLSHFSGAAWPRPGQVGSPALFTPALEARKVLYLFCILKNVPKHTSGSLLFPHNHNNRNCELFAFKTPQPYCL